MLNRRTLLAGSAALAGTAALFARSAYALKVQLAEHFEVARFIDGDSVELLWGLQRKVVRRGEVFITHTLIEIVDGDFVVLEDFRAIDGHIVIADKGGPRHVLTRTAESTAPVAAPSLEAANALTQQIMGGTADPDYDSVAGAFGPIRKVAGDGYAGIGIPGKAVAIDIAGRTAEFDPASIQPSITAIRDAGGTLTGLAGGYLPVARFVWPEGTAWTELLAFVSFAGTTWYRVTRVENGALAWSRVFAPAEGDTKRFYADLEAAKAGWDARLKPGMQVDLPDERMADMARFGLVRLMIDQAQSPALAAWGIIPPFPEIEWQVETPHNTLLGMPVENGDATSGGLALGSFKDLIANDRVREALLLASASMAHLHTRGTWTAPDRRHLLSAEADAWSARTQQIVPEILKDLLVYETDDTLWLGRAMPRPWLDDGKLLFIDNAPTRWGAVGFALDSRRKDQHRIAAKITLPDGGLPVPVKLRLRTHDLAPMRGVSVNDKSWHDFDPQAETVTLPAGMGGAVLLQVRY